MNSTNSEKTVEKLRSVFAAYGLPEEIVTDNGPQFTSACFETFLKRNGIRHTKTPPYHPASNGTAERCVQTLKRHLLKQVLEEKQNGEPRSLQHRIDQFLFTYRNTPTGTTGETPAQLFLSWKPRTRLSLLHPDLEQRMQEKLERRKDTANQTRGKWREFVAGQPVFVNGLRPDEETWLAAIVLKHDLRPRRVPENSTPNIRPTESYDEPDTAPLVTPTRVPEGMDAGAGDLTSVFAPDMVLRNSSQQQGTTSPIQSPPKQAGTASPQGHSPPPLRRSNRERRPPDRYVP
ncbi:uncharacterized protein K02A2.6-like [Rhipicephalus sanguineus]|uniref:uncharacterized protein K02A2.6-like n=1 Tax=Rhipicephalus sanguineus TaxID=34632 RepID=UPI0018956C88|nr:uncharacterized protein K02A2.6-like [Rhipicephalus sanguineus]